jgi:hypothetical protein
LKGLELSERDSLRVLALLENPPKPNAKLLAAATSWLGCAKHSIEISGDIAEPVGAFSRWAGPV